MADDARSIPAIGPASRMSRQRHRLRVALLLLGVAAFAVALVSRFALATPASERVPTVLNAAWVVPGELMRGGQPQDINFVDMRDIFGITAIVNFRAASRIERHVVRGFHLEYVWLRLPPGGAPNEAQLRRLVKVLRREVRSDGSVFMHDQSGLDEAPAVAVMLEMLHGKPVREAIDDATDATPSDRPIITRPQYAAINALARSLGQEPVRPRGHRPPGRPPYRYPHAAELRW